MSEPYGVVLEQRDRALRDYERIEKVNLLLVESEAKANARIEDLEDRVRAADTALNDMLLDMNDDAALPFGYESRIARITAALAGEKKP